MKKNIFTLFLLTILLIPSLIFAQGEKNPPPLKEGTGIKGTVDELFKIEKFKTSEGKQINDTSLIENLPQSQKEETYSDLFSSLTKIALGAATILVFVGLIVSGIMFVFAQGDETKLTNAKNVLVYMIIGVAIIAAAYAIVIGITNLTPFSK